MTGLGSCSRHYSRYLSSRLATRRRQPALSAGIRCSISSWSPASRRSSGSIWIRRRRSKCTRILRRSRGSSGGGWREEIADMAKSVFHGVRISGVAGAVPKNALNNLTDHEFCPVEDRKKIIALTKVAGYRKAPAEICASDLCRAAAETLLAGLERKPDEIDAIVLATITPDYRVPSTACVLQHRLNCRNTVVAYDISMGCSGYVVGLYNACSLIRGAGLKRVLLLTGDTQSKLCYEQDKNVVFILGDGGTATLLEADAGAGDIVVELMTDGARFENLYVPAGGFRRPSTEATRQVREQADGGR